MDAAFGSLSMCDMLIMLGWNFTMGVNRNKESWFWEEMCWGCSNQQGRIMCNKHKVYASLYVDSKNHIVFTNDWVKRDEKNDENSDVEEGREESNEESDGEKSDNVDENMSECENESSGSVSESKDWVVKQILKRKINPKNANTTYQVLWSTGEKTYEPFKSFIDDNQVCAPFLHFSIKYDFIQGYKMYSTKELVDICTALGLRKGMFFFQCEFLNF